MAKPELTIALLQQEAKIFGQQESKHDESKLYGITDGKAVGTYLEHKFQGYLQRILGKVFREPRRAHDHAVA